MKLFLSLIKSRIVNYIEQARFRKNFSIIDYLQTINLLIEKCEEYLPVYYAHIA